MEVREGGDDEGPHLAPPRAVPRGHEPVVVDQVATRRRQRGGGGGHPWRPDVGGRTPTDPHPAGGAGGERGGGGEGHAARPGTGPPPPSVTEGSPQVGHVGHPGGEGHRRTAAPLPAPDRRLVQQRRSEGLAMQQLRRQRVRLKVTDGLVALRGEDHHHVVGIEPVDDAAERRVDRPVHRIERRLTDPRARRLPQHRLGRHAVPRVVAQLVRLGEGHDAQGPVRRGRQEVLDHLRALLDGRDQGRAERLEPLGVVPRAGVLESGRGVLPDQLVELGHDRRRRRTPRVHRVMGQPVHDVHPPEVPSQGNSGDVERHDRRAVAQGPERLPVECARRGVAIRGRVEVDRRPPTGVAGLEARGERRPGVLGPAEVIDGE